MTFLFVVLLLAYLAFHDHETEVTKRTSDASDMLQYSTSPGNVEIQPDYAVTDDGR